MKTEHKQIYIEKYGLSKLREFGFGDSFVSGQTLINTAYMTLPELRRTIRQFLRGEIKVKIED